MTRVLRRVAKDMGVLLVIMLFLLPFVTFWFVGASTAGQLYAEIIASYCLFWGLMALLSDRPRDEMRKLFLLTSMTLLFSFAILEAPSALGIIDYRSILSVAPSHYWDEPGRIFDDELLWRSVPHYQTHIKYTRGNVGDQTCMPPGPLREFDLRYDHNGFRNDVDLMSADIAVIGDSYVESPMMDSSHLMTSLLAQMQQKVVANLGMSGYGPQQELIVLKRYALQLHPKTIVWVFYGGNDLHNVDEYKSLKEVVRMEGTFSKLWQRSLLKTVMSAVSHVSHGCKNPYAGRYMDIRFGADTPRYYFFYGDHPLEYPLLKALKEVRSMFAEAFQISHELGAQLVIVYAPTPYAVHHGLPNAVEVSEEVRTWALNDLSDRIHAMLNEISPDIGYVDLRPFLRATAEKGIPVFWPDDTHWTAEGHRVVAKAISEFLKAHPSTQPYE